MYKVTSCLTIWGERCGARHVSVVRSLCVHSPFSCCSFSAHWRQARLQVQWRIHASLVTEEWDPSVSPYGSLHLRFKTASTFASVRSLLLMARYDGNWENEGDALLLVVFFLFIHLFLCQLKETLAKVPPNHVGKPLLKKPMGPAHWVSRDPPESAL